MEGLDRSRAVYSQPNLKIMSATTIWFARLTLSSMAWILASLALTVCAAGNRSARYHPATLLKIYIYGYLNRVPSSRRLERECQRNIELIWLTGHLAPDFKTIADFRKDNGRAIREVCRDLRGAVPQA